MDIATRSAVEDKSGPKHKSLTLDLAFYEDQLSDPELSEQEREDILIALWTIMCCFVDLGYRIEPQQSCGQLPASLEGAAPAKSNPVDSRQQPETKQPQIAGPMLRQAESEET